LGAGLVCAEIVVDAAASINAAKAAVIITFISTLQ
jgi:hypothetical protein